MKLFKGRIVKISGDRELLRYLKNCIVDDK